MYTFYSLARGYRMDSAPTHSRTLTYILLQYECACIVYTLYTMYTMYTMCTMYDVYTNDVYDML